jgi:hypothetical protein
MFDHLSEDELVAELAAQAARVDAGLCRLLELVAECKQRVAWGGEGTTFAQWLAWRCSLRPRQAREHERVAERLGELPAIRDAFSRGELSYGKVGTLTRVAEPANEEKLVELAEVMTASQLERAVGAYRQVSKREAAEQQERKFLSYFWQDDGSLALRARLAADDGAVVVRALDAGREALREQRRAKRTAGDYELPRSENLISNADALVAMADLALANPDADRSGGDRCQVVVHVDAQTLAAHADGRCELDEGWPLAAETARRLACDASVVELLERDAEVLSLGRKRRTISPALRRALAARDRGCRFPGCDSRRFVDAHHLQHWSQGGETNLDNLVLICRRHHTLVHERGYTVEFGDDGEVHFRNQYGVAIPNTPPRPPPSGPSGLGDQLRRDGHVIDAATCRNGDGDRMDLGYAVDALISIAGLPSADT